MDSLTPLPFVANTNSAAGWNSPQAECGMGILEIPGVRGAQVGALLDPCGALVQV